MSQDRTSIAGQISLVTGAASGIGRAAALLLAARGAQVIALDLNEAGLKSVTDEIKKNGASASYKILDLGSEESIRGVVKEIENEYGHIDSVVNAGGITGPTGVITEEIAWDAFHKTLSVNLFGAIWLTQAVLPLMKERKYGRIVQVASIAGKEGNPGMSPYNTSKAGLIGYVKGAAKEAAPFGITINSLAPAVIRTPINEKTAEETLKYMIARIPMGRVGEAEEVAELIAFMASPACSFTTGFTFDISGGRATY
jgi:NAD(P)-dependent dehydrogenase (short-subunit alcohol dehydrogenase family)